MSLTALSFLGVGEYATTTYTWRGKKSTTRYMPTAVRDLFEPDALFVAGTPSAWSVHGGQLKASCAYTPVRMSRASGTSNWWEMFNAITEAVPEQATLLVDITHGFRWQPFLALAVVLYLRAVKDVTIERIIYGAYEAGSNGHSPIVDLTSFLRLIDWAIATEQFKKYGDASSLRDVFLDIAGESQREGRLALNLKPAGEVMRRLTRALDLNRPLETIEQSRGLIDVLEQAMQDALSIPQARPVKRLLLPIARRFAPLGHADGSAFTARGFAAQAGILRFYVETRQYLHAFTLAQEMIVSWVCVREGFDPLDRGLSRVRADYEGREGGRALLRDWSDAARRDADAWDDLYADERTAVALWNALRNQRNDVAHAGFSYNPTPSAELIEDAKSVLCEVADFIDPKQ